MEWIEAALEPIRAELTDEQYDRLVSGLAVLIGFETEQRVVTWAAAALLEAMRAEVGGQRPISGWGR